jgi:hypothetical protein
MSPAGFEPAIPGSEQPQTHALDQATTWIGESVNGTQCEYDHRRRRKSDVYKVMVPLTLIHILTNSLSLCCLPTGIRLLFCVTVVFNCKHLASTGNNTWHALRRWVRKRLQPYFNPPFQHLFWTTNKKKSIQECRSREQDRKTEPPVHKSGI